MNWANRLTILRVLLVPVFVLAILYGKLSLAFVIFVVAALTDAADGYIARVRKEKTKFGAIMDPIADKLLIATALICFSLVSGLPPHLKMPIYVPIIVISRDVIIILGAMSIYLLAGNIEVKPSIIGKLTTVFQMLTIIAVLLQFPWASWIWNTAVVFTLASGIDYIRIGSKQVNGKF